MVISLDNFRAGLSWWLDKDNWGRDLINAEYDGIYNDRAEGVTERWWGATVTRLGQWQAYRGSKPPNSKLEITQRGLQQLAYLSEEYSRLMSNPMMEPSIADQSWEDIVPVFAIAYRIKPSPVFAGKMCHFLFPNLFIVMDNVATSVSNYEIYWRGMKSAWCSFKDKESLRNALATAIGSGKPIHQRYPFETKIIELCHIGLCHPERHPSIS
jgi:hypothetical protein